MPYSTVGLLLALTAALAHAAADDAPHYAVSFDATTSSAQVQLCLAYAHARVRFDADSSGAMRYVRDLRRDSGRALDSTDRSWVASDWRAGECLSYRADLGAIADAHQPDVGWRIGTDLVAAPQLWLLRPDTWNAGAAQIRVELPPGWSISAPWMRESSDGKSITFHIPATPPDWSAAVAFGQFAEQRIELSGSVLRLTILGNSAAEDRAKLRAWLERVAHAVLDAYGRLPLADVQVLMIPVAGRSAVRFGQSVRGQGNALQLLVDPTRPASEFADDWVAVHELSHLMHPYLGDRGAWLAEGLATYYQNVLRARGRIYTPAQAWAELGDGFRRGAQRVGDDTLERAAMDMHRTHAYQRVYWAGAAFWLTVDRDLRRASDGKQGLDGVLAKFRDCCLPAYREWEPDEFIARLDALAGTTLIGARYRESAAARAFPDWRSVYDDLGIRGEGDALHFDAGARDAKLRDAITTAWRAPR